MRRRVILIGLIAIIIVIGSVAVVYFVNRSPSLSNTVLKLANQSTETNINSAPTNENTNAAVDTEAASIEYVARNFAESYGSYNNQNAYANLDLAKTWCTPGYQAYLDRLATQHQSSVNVSTYQSTTSQALVITITKRAKTAVSVTVSMQRQDVIDSTTKDYTQDLNLDLIKSGDTWLVNAAAWQPVS